MQLSGMSVIVTGASSGIGRAVAVELARSGCRLILTALEEDLLSALCHELAERFSVQVESRALDLSDAASRSDLVRWILSRVPEPDILVNNAGIGGDFGRFERVPLESLERAIAVNVSAFVHLSHALIPVLRRRPRAKIVNISSGIARLPYPGLAVYGATKGFVSSLSESLACELAGSRVDVLCFHPGFTDTAFIGASKMDLSRIPRRMIHPPERIARRIVRAMESDASWAFSDFVTRISNAAGSLLPARIKTRIFKNLYWRLPDDK
jgi:uncharacterized protein